jgi:hypothetical protein
MEIRKVDLEQDLIGILTLQSENLFSNISEEEKQSQGFVTVCHSLDQIRNLNQKEKHIIASDGDKVLAYALAMTEESKLEIPVLVPMFEIFNNLEYKKRKYQSRNT